MEHIIDGHKFCASDEKLTKIYEDTFEELYDGGDIIFFQSKETYDSEDEDLPFKYKLCIEACYCEGAWFYGLAIVPALESLSEKNRKSVQEFSCEDATFEDICAYGFGINLCDDKTEGEEINETKLKELAYIAPMVNSMRGFYLDRRLNAMGNTGWDFLEHAIRDKPLW